MSGRKERGAADISPELSCLPCDTHQMRTCKKQAVNNTNTLLKLLVIRFCVTSNWKHSRRVRKKMLSVPLWDSPGVDPRPREIIVKSRSQEVRSQLHSGLNKVAAGQPELRHVLGVTNTGPTSPPWRRYSTKAPFWRLIRSFQLQCMALQSKLVL